ncbi:hypothetical protein PCASD_11088 [Puccinia coronata f. sp. avenae]|uniref:Uncharacterized protein n=1 Tax=Puccinia coronata f. sp. avenae TaxID=200324 RepID=A0A2N5TBA8_9BASI|nr:hypothetical protein PCASD_11088 [Puccinia coronata f. sp. avenae]
MRRLLVGYCFCLALILIDGGSLQLATATPGKGLDIDLNLPALAEEEPCFTSATALTFDPNRVEEPRSIAPFDSATSRAAPTFIASTRKNYVLPWDNSQSFTPSSSELSMSLGSTADANIHQDWNRPVHQPMSTFFREDERDPNSLKQQVGVTGQGGTRIPKMSRAKKLQLLGVRRVPRMNKSKGARVTPQHTPNDRTSPELTQPGNSPGVLNVQDWEFVKVKEGAAIINRYLEPPGEERDEKDLFQFLEKRKKAKQENSAEVFWIPREQEMDFFKKFSAREFRLFSYPNPGSFTSAQRASAIQQIVLELYYSKVKAHQKNDFKFLAGIASQLSVIRPERIARVERIIRTSTVFSILYLLLYREQPASMNDHVLEFTNCVQGLLKGLRKKERTEEKLVMKWYDSINLRSFSSEKQLTLSWATVDYWLRSMKHHLTLPSPYNRRPPKKFCHKTLAEVVHKIIFFSNCKFF